MSARQWTRICWTRSRWSFRFDEDLCFNIPFQPVVSVTGRCVLKRDDPQSGRIVQYREWWNQSLFEVVKTAFNRPKV